MHFGHIFVPAARVARAYGGLALAVRWSGHIRPLRTSLRLFFRILFGYSRMRRPAREALNAGVVHAACGFVVYAGYYPACRFLFCLLGVLFSPVFRRLSLRHVLITSYRHDDFSKKSLIYLHISKFLRTFAPANSRWGVCIDATGEGADIFNGVY